jgi:hypothetical protein
VTDLLEGAAGFVWRSGRLIDRHRFTHLFLGGDRAPVLAALAAYQNPDGGFGNALEPDLRGPGSQPEPVEVAFWVLDEVGAMDGPMVAAACDWLATVTTVADRARPAGRAGADGGHRRPAAQAPGRPPVAGGGDRLLLAGDRRHDRDQPL